jgi:hypothetical protein
VCPPPPDPFQESNPPQFEPFDFRTVLKLPIPSETMSIRPIRHVPVFVANREELRVLELLPEVSPSSIPTSFSTNQGEL